MKNNKINKLIEYLAPTLIISYFFIHHISLVLLGICFSFYILNIDYIYKIKNLISQSLKSTKVAKELEEDYRPIESNSNKIEWNKEDSRLTLVETIEEFGFIPSANKNDDKNAA